MPIFVIAAKQPEQMMKKPLTKQQGLELALLHEQCVSCRDTMSSPMSSEQQKQIAFEVFGESQLKFGRLLASLAETN